MVQPALGSPPRAPTCQHQFRSPRHLCCTSGCHGDEWGGECVHTGPWAPPRCPHKPCTQTGCRHAHTMSTRLHTHSDPPAAVCPKPGNGPRAWGQMLTARRHTLVWDARGPARSHSDLDHCPLQRLSGGSRHLLFCPLLSFHNSAREGFWKLSLSLQLKKQRLRERWLAQGHWDNSRGLWGRGGVPWRASRIQKTSWPRPAPPPPRGQRQLQAGQAGHRPQELPAYDSASNPSNEVRKG